MSFQSGPSATAESPKNPLISLGEAEALERKEKFVYMCEQNWHPPKSFGWVP